MPIIRAVPWKSSPSTTSASSVGQVRHSGTVHNASAMTRPVTPGSSQPRTKAATIPKKPNRSAVK
jgi:hypothetical protein